MLDARPGTPADHEATGGDRLRSASPNPRRAHGAGALVTWLATVGLASAGPAAARAEPRVLLLRPVPTSATLAEASLRIKSELAAGGFDVTVADIDAKEPVSDPRALMERAGQDLAPSATLGIFGDVDQGPAELWVVDRITGKTVVRRLEVEATSDRRISEVLAVRAQELLRASLVELLLQQSRPTPPNRPPPPQVVQRWVKDAVASPVAPWFLGIELGASAFGGWGGIGPAVAPAARLRMALHERW